MGIRQPRLRVLLQRLRLLTWHMRTGNRSQTHTLELKLEPACAAIRHVQIRREEMT